MLDRKLKEQIEQDANDYSLIKFEETWHKKGLHRKNLLRYAYQDGAESYAGKLQDAEQKVEKMEAALKHIATFKQTGESDISDTDAAYGYNSMIEVAREALTTKTATDE